MDIYRLGQTVFIPKSGLYTCPYSLLIRYLNMSKIDLNAKSDQFVFRNVYHVLPCITTYCHVKPCIALYCHVLPCTTMYYHVLPFIHVLPCIHMYCYLLVCITMYCHVLPSTAMYSHV